MNYDGSTNKTENNTTVAVTKTSNVTANATKNATATHAPVQQKQYILYFVSQENCPYCTQMHPLIITWVSAHKNVELREVLTGSDIANGFGVRAAPTTILVDKDTNKEVTRFAGVFDPEDLNRYVV
jgi:thioredoxin-related protein